MPDEFPASDAISLARRRLADAVTRAAAEHRALEVALDSRSRSDRPFGTVDRALVEQIAVLFTNAWESMRDLRRELDS